MQSFTTFAKRSQPQRRYTPYSSRAPRAQVICSACVMLRRLAQRLHKPLTANAECPIHVECIPAPVAVARSQVTSAQPAAGIGIAAAQRPQLAVEALAATARTSAASIPSVSAQRHFSSGPEFTAAGGSPPQFTAGPDPRAAAGAAAEAAGPQHEAGAAGDAGSDERNGDVDAVLERVQEAALAHVVRFGIFVAAFGVIARLDGQLAAAKQSYCGLQYSRRTAVSHSHWACHKGRISIVVMFYRRKWAGHTRRWWPALVTWACRPRSPGHWRREAPTSSR